jgi:hypothetical protein
MADAQHGSAPTLIAIGWSLLVALGGGFACGWCISELGTTGAVFLAACGGLAGFVSRKITRRANTLAGICQAVAICVAFGIAETCWLHWHTRNGQPSWWAAIRVWPIFLREYTIAAGFAAAFAACGAWWAYSLAAAPDVRASKTAGPP